MLRFVLLVVLTIVFIKNDVICGTLGRISKSDESLLPRAERELPSHWTRLNLAFPSGNKVLVNTTRRLARSDDTITKRQAKFFPKFSILAGLDIGSGLSSSRVATNLTPIAKITQANRFPDIINPYFAASYDPYPPSNTVEQSIQALYRLVERLSQQVDNFNNNNSAVTANALFNSEKINADIIDDRKRRKDKIKAKKTTPKRKKQEEVEERDEEEIDDVKPKKQESQKVQKSKKVKKNSKNGARKGPGSRQAVPANDTSSESNSSMDNSMDSSMDSSMSSSMETNTTIGANATQTPGYYYGGNPQNIDNVGFTYERPQQTYGSPSNNYGPPSNNYGPPSTNYGTPSYSYGSPSYNYGPPSRGYGAPYELAHYTAYNDHEPIIYDDPNESSFGPSVSSERWQQRLPFARSQNLATTTSQPIVANRNGFVPIL